MVKWFLVLAMILLLAVSHTKAETGKEDSKCLQGTWEIVAAEWDGEEASNLLTKNNLRKVTVKGDKINVWLEGYMGAKDTDEGGWRIRLFASKTPKQFEFHQFEKSV